MSQTLEQPWRRRLATVTGRALPEGPGIARAAAGIGLYAAVFGATFGAVAVSSGFGILQAVVMSVVMLTGASQFALVSVVAAGGSPLSGLSTALLLGVRNMFYGVPVTQVVRPRGLRRAWTAHFVIDETTAMSVAQSNPRAGRFAFWVTGITLATMWIAGTFAGALLGRSVNPAALGLSAASPAIFLALLWPQLSRDRAPAVAAGASAVALILIPLVPAGVPIIAAAGVAIAVGMTGPASETHDKASR